MPVAVLGCTDAAGQELLPIAWSDWKPPPFSTHLVPMQCAGVPSIEDIVAGLVAAEPKAVADMSTEERRAALLTHLCHMQVRQAVLRLLGRPYWGCCVWQISRSLQLCLGSAPI